VALWDGREIPCLDMGCWAIGGPFYAGDVPLRRAKSVTINRSALSSGHQQSSVILPQPT